MYPTFVLIDNEEKELGRQKGSLDGGPSAFIKLLNTFYTPTEDTSNVKSPNSGGDFDSFFKKPKPSPTPLMIFLISAALRARIGRLRCSSAVLFSSLG